MSLQHQDPQLCNVATMSAITSPMTTLIPQQNSVSQYQIRQKSQSCTANTTSLVVIMPSRWRHHTPTNHANTDTVLGHTTAEIATRGGDHPNGSR